MGWALTYMYLYMDGWARRERDRPGGAGRVSIDGSGGQGVEKRFSGGDRGKKDREPTS